MKRGARSIASSLAAARIGVAFLFLAGCSTLEPAPAAEAVPASPETLAHGAYLARIANCLSCHTEPGGAPFGGGRAIPTPFGDFVSSNITPAPDAGLGDWTEAEFARAVRRGVRPDGGRLYPVMPTESFAHLSDADVGALWAYLQSVQPAAAEAPRHALSFPFNLRPGLRAWRLLFFEPAPYAPAAADEADWSRGAYLVEAVAHCGACHSPRNRLGAINQRRRLTGGFAEGWLAPDISGGPSSRLAGWSEEQLVRFLRTGETEGAAAVGPMTDVVREGLAFLSDEDAHAIAVYLKTPAPAPD